MKALSENPGIKLLPNNDGVPTGWDPDKGTKLITDLINSGGYDNVQGIWTSGIDQQVVDAIKAADKPFVPIVGADLKGFVEMLLNKTAATTGSRASRSTTLRRSAAPVSTWRSRRSMATHRSRRDRQGPTGPTTQGHLPADVGVV